MTESSVLDSEQEATWRAFVRAARLLSEELDRELQRDAGMPQTYYEILLRLSEAPDGTMRMSDLAACSVLSRSRLSHAVARLEEAGWVCREECPTDRRGAYAVLSEAGVTALQGATPGRVDSIRAHLFAQLAPPQVAQLRSISEALVQHLSG